MDGHLHTMDPQGLGEFISTREGLLSIIEQLRGGAKQRWPFEKMVKPIVEELFKKRYCRNTPQGLARLWQEYPLQVNPELTWFRARELGEGGKSFSNASELGPRSAKDTKEYGRCHVPGAPVGYCSLYEDIALAEKNAETGKRYALAAYELTEELIVLPVGEYDFFRRTGQTYLGSVDPNAKAHYGKIQDGPDGRLLEVVDAFFAEEFISPASRDTDYRVTAALSDLLFNSVAGVDGQKHRIDAIFYPSVAYRAGYNLAIQPEAMEKKMCLVPSQTRIVRVTEAIGYGIFEKEDECILQAVGTDGTLKWK